MKLRNRRLSIIFIALYLLGIIVSAFTLFNFKNKLVYDLNVLTISDIGLVVPVFNQLNIIVGASMILGLLAAYFSFKADETNVIYIEREGEDEEEETDVSENESSEEYKIDKEALTQLVKAKNPLEIATLNRLLNAICKQLEASQGAFYLSGTKKGKNMVKLIASYAMSIAESEDVTFEYGEGLIGQAAKEKKTLYLNDLPQGFIKIFSGLGEASPKYLLIVPVLSNDQLLGIVEVASFTAIRRRDIMALEEALRSYNKNPEEGTITGDENFTVVDGETVLISPESKTKKKKSRSK